ncbi:MAG: glycoside hydrolase [Bryobacteraceae bacterium]|nr:glycoside hydrolase [Bryobacteraceae bacterium]
MQRRDLLLLPSLAFAQDPREITTGSVIPDEFYADQPYVVKTDDGAWLCVITTGPGHEGDGGQHVISLRSLDRGKTWEKPVDVEPATGPEASYAVLLKVPSGRVYVFYNHNTDRVKEVIADNPPYATGFNRRVDSLGHFVCKYSDDHGRTWSVQRYEIPQRDFAIDRKNPYGGKLKFFWTVGRAFSHQGAGYVPLHKVGGFGEGFFTSSEGVLLRSANILTERDPAKLTWETLPEGDVGIRTPAGGGPVAEEQSFSILSDDSLFCVYRTIDGHSACTYSRNGGRSWEAPQYMRFASGRLMKHPRAATFAWRCENGRFLYWFHNHGGRFIREHPRRRTIAYEDRNPVWVCGGTEVDGPTGKRLTWSEPEVLLYDDDSMIRMSYPDLIEEGGEYYITETQKDVARVHRLDKTLLAGLWNQASAKGVPQAGLLLRVPRGTLSATAPEFPIFTKRSRRSDYGLEHTRAGVTLDLFLALPDLAAGQTLLDNRDEQGKGIHLATGPSGTLVIELSDGRARSRWSSDRNALSAGKLHHAAIIIDGGPHIISFVVDGLFQDGGDERQFGWGRYHPQTQSLNGAPKLRLSPHLRRTLLYGRALRTSEAIASFRAGPEA